MTIAQQSLVYNFNSNWLIRRPVIYRYLDKKWVDAFFNDGSIRLSSFTKFGKHDDEQRLDIHEGMGQVTNKANNGQFITAVMGQGHNAYVLCAATLYSENIANDFKTDSGFRINDIFAFSNAISRYIPGFIGGIEGPCHYLQNKVLNRRMQGVDLDSMKIPGSNDLDMEKMFQALGAYAGDDLFFLKNDIFSPQNEYRLLWMTPNRNSDVLDIKCPDAIQFCTRFEDL